MNEISVLELFSGIGGMRAALTETKVPFHVVGTYEINPMALKLYQHNFEAEKKTNEMNILGIDVEMFEHMNPTLLVMSPPCQPFTRQGLKKDTQDSRCLPFLHILSLLEKANVIPAMILMENVAGFEVSDARGMFIEVLKKRNYQTQEFLLTPYQFGIPNARLRYYLLAKRLPDVFPFKLCDEVQSSLSVCTCYRDEVDHLDVDSKCQNCGSIIHKNISTFIRNTFSVLIANCNPNKLISEPVDLQGLNLELSNFLETIDDITPYLVKEKILLKYASVFDIVNSSDVQSCCFTKGYSHYVQGTGSVLQNNNKANLDNVFKSLQDSSINDSDYQQLLLSLNLRYFTPKEILRLLCFPKYFEIPQSCNTKQSYKVLGNSINVFIVTLLLLLLLE